MKKNAMKSILFILFISIMLIASLNIVLARFRQGGADTYYDIVRACKDGMEISLAINSGKYDLNDPPTLDGTLLLDGSTVITPTLIIDSLALTSTVSIPGLPDGSYRMGSPIATWSTPLQPGSRVALHLDVPNSNVIDSIYTTVENCNVTDPAPADSYIESLGNAKEIPGTGVVVTSTIIVPSGHQPIGDVNVAMWISIDQQSSSGMQYAHTLTVSLTSPDGNKVALFDVNVAAPPNQKDAFGSRCNYDNNGLIGDDKADFILDDDSVFQFGDPEVTTPFINTAVKPMEPLSMTFNGPASGTWELELINQSNPAESLYLNCWYLEIEDVQHQLTIDDSTVIEGDSGTASAVFTVTLTPDSSQTVTVDYTTANGTATAGNDFTTITDTLTFIPGETTKIISVPIIGDTNDESDETFTVNLSNSVNADILDAQATGTIIDDDGPPQLTISDQTVLEGDIGLTNAHFTVTLSPSSNAIVTVDYTTADGTATAGNDFTAITDTLTFNPGETTKIISVPIIGDTNDELDETFTVNLSNSVNADILDAQVTGTIVDDDGPPQLTISDQTVLEGDIGLTNAQFTVTLSPSSNTMVTVDYTTANGTATAGSDFTAITDTLTFDPGETTKIISVPVIGDTNDESDETFTVNLSNNVNADILDAQATGTIVDDDGPPQLTISDQTVLEGDIGLTNAQFTVTLSPSSNGVVTVDYNTVDGTATADSDFTAITDTLTFNSGETTKIISVPVIGDTNVESDETFTVNLSNGVNADILDNEATGTIIDDDGGYLIYLPVILRK